MRSSLVSVDDQHSESGPSKRRAYPVIDRRWTRASHFKGLGGRSSRAECGDTVPSEQVVGEKTEKPRRYLAVGVSRGGTIACYRQAVLLSLMGPTHRVHVATNTAVMSKMAPMPMTPTRSPNCWVIQPKAVIPAIAAVMAPVP
jgi:hypothetical protein